LTRITPGFLDAWFGRKKGSSIDAGNLWENSAVASCLAWATDNFAEAPLKIEVRSNVDAKSVEWSPIELGDLAQHLIDLIANPNPFYDGDTLEAATIVSLSIDGNGYWFKERDGVGIVAALWWLPHWMVTPQWDGNGQNFITHYEYNLGGGIKPIEIPTTEIVHFRRGLDFANMRKGWAPLRSAIAEVATDNEATVYTHFVLKNLGVTTGVVSPKIIKKPGGEVERATFGGQEEAVKEKLHEKTTGAERGKFLVLDYPLDVTPLGMSPEQMALDKIRRIPESRICSTLRIPAMVVGLAVGDEQRTYANMKEAREQGAEEFIVPVGRLLASAIHRQLIGDFVRDPKSYRVSFDYSQMRIMSEDRSKLITDWVTAYQGGIAMRSEARGRIGLQVRDKGEDDIFITDATLTGPDLTNNPDALAQQKSKSAATWRQRLGN